MLGVTAGGARAPVPPRLNPPLFTDEFSRCALCVIKSAIRHGTKFMLKYPDVHDVSGLRCCPVILRT